MSEVRYKNWDLLLRADELRAGAPYLQWRFAAACAKNGMIEWQTSRKWYLSEHMTESELVLTAFKAALTAEEHECRERFLYRGRRILNPHVSVRALLDVCEIEDVRP